MLIPPQSTTSRGAAARPVPAMWRGLPRRRTSGALVGLFLAAAALLFAAPAASAGTGTGCSQDSCNGLDPGLSYDTGTGNQCSAGAGTALKKAALGGTLELR